MDGWNVAGWAIMFAAGLLIGVSLISKRPIINNVTQTVETTVHAGDGGGIRGFVSGTVFPVLALGAVVLVVVALASALLNTNAQVSAIAQHSIDAQTKAVQSVPQPQIVIEAPKPQPTVIQPPMDLMPIVNTIGTILGTGFSVFMLFQIGKTIVQTRRSDREYKQRQEALRLANSYYRPSLPEPVQPVVNAYEERYEHPLFMRKNESVKHD